MRFFLLLLSLIAAVLASECLPDEYMNAFCKDESATDEDCTKAGCLWCPGLPFPDPEVCTWKDNKCGDCRPFTAEEKKEFDANNSGMCVNKDGPSCLFVVTPDPPGNDYLRDGDDCIPEKFSFNVRKGKCPTSAASRATWAPIVVVALIFALL